MTRVVVTAVMRNDRLEGWLGGCFDGCAANVSRARGSVTFEYGHGRIVPAKTADSATAYGT
jgi:hypothetical protein